MSPVRRGPTILVILHYLSEYLLTDLNLLQHNLNEIMIIALFENLPKLLLYFEKTAFVTLSLGGMSNR